MRHRVVLVVGLSAVCRNGRARLTPNHAACVKDDSGAVIPGVTVEAASPALIEKVGPGQRRNRPVQDRQPQPGHLHGHLHAAGLLDRQA